MFCFLGQAILAFFSFLAISHAFIENNRLQRISLFSVVQFPNDPCQGSSTKNGTCYTAEECDQRGGVAAGTCADGYGVCCTISLDCGAASAENLTYLVMSSTSTPPNKCEYRICKATDRICRIRFDLQLFTLAPPAVEASTNDGLYGGSIGDCVTDIFTVSGSYSGSPAICGKNAGQHIYADINNDCVRAAFLFGVSSSVSRQYSIKVSQYVCNDEIGGPIGCLQYFTATSGTVASFNFPIGTSSIASATTITHLSNQNYDICFRRADDNCRLCFTPSIATDPASYGLGEAADTNNRGTVSTSCIADYLIIPQSDVSTISNDPIHNSAIANIDRICGRKFNTITTESSHKTICTARRPFSIKFRSDMNEDDVANSPTVINDETNGTPKGYIGFSLDFFQESC